METKRTKKQEMRGLSVLFFLLYFVQKVSNHFEGVTKIPVQNLLKLSVDKGGLGLSTAASGHFITNSGLGWYVKALLGAVTDNLPLFGYRRKSWLIVSALGAGLAWFSAAMGNSSAITLFIGLIIANMCVAFGDVIVDGLMVESSQRLERTGGHASGVISKKLQASQWLGAYSAILISALAGGVIAQLFNFKTAAVISGIFPLLTIILIALVVHEEKVTWNWAEAKIGFAALALLGVVSFAILQLKGLPAENPIKPFEPIISGVLIIGGMLLLVRIPRTLMFPIVLMFLWRSTPFNRDSMYMYQYFTTDNLAFLKTLNEQSSIVPMLKNLVVALHITDAQTLDKSGFQEIFWGSVVEVVSAIMGLVGAFCFRKFWSEVPLHRVFLACIGANAVVAICFLMFPLGITTSPGFLLFTAMGDGFLLMVILLSILGYAAERTPEHNQASIFAFYMGMANLGQTLGIQTLGGKLYAVFGGAAERMVQNPEGKMVPEPYMATPDSGVIAVIAVALVYLALLALLVRHMKKCGYI